MVDPLFYLVLVSLRDKPHREKQDNVSDKRGQQYPKQEIQRREGQIGCRVGYPLQRQCNVVCDKGDEAHPRYRAHRDHGNALQCVCFVEQTGKGQKRKSSIP